MEKTTLRQVTTATRQDASAKGKADNAFLAACETIAIAFLDEGVEAAKGKHFAAIREAAISGWQSGNMPMEESGAKQRWLRASRNALRMVGRAEYWESKVYTDAKFESAGGRGLDSDWQPCKPAPKVADGSKTEKPAKVCGPETGSPTPANDSAGNTSAGKQGATELHIGAVADLTEILELASDSPAGNRIAALATSAIRKLEIATDSQLT